MASSIPVRIWVLFFDRAHAGELHITGFREDICVRDFFPEKRQKLYVWWRKDLMFINKPPNAGSAICAKELASKNRDLICAYLLWASCPCVSSRSWKELSNIWSQGATRASRLLSKLSRVDAACLTLSGTWMAMSAKTLQSSFPC
jgi:hypothetical protein